MRACVTVALLLGASAPLGCGRDTQGLGEGARAPAIALSATALTFNAAERGQDPGEQAVAVTNSGGGSLDGLHAAVTYMSGQPGDWLSVSLSSTAAPSTLTVVARVGALAAGSYAATVSVTANGGGTSRAVAVAFVVAAQPPSIALSRTSVGMSATVGGSPGAQTVSITNGGGGALTGLTTSIAYAAGQPTGWLTAALSSTTAPSTLTLAASAAPLSVGSYSATVTLAAAAASARVVTVTLTVSAPPVAMFPLSAGRKWLYTLIDTTTAVSGGIAGVSRFYTQGRLILHVAEAGTLSGRSAWRTHWYELNDRLSAGEPALQVYTLYLSSDSDGLLQYTGGSWRSVTSASRTTITGGAMLLGGTIRHSPQVTQSSGSISVPAGTFQATRTRHYFREGFTNYSAEDINEERIEYFAPGVGSVYAFWDYVYEDNLGGPALYSRRTVRLTHVDTGPFPSLQSEGLTNTGASSAQSLSLPSLVWGTARLGDAGTTLTDAGVGCTAVCIQPNANGQKRIEDWYAFTLQSGANVRIDLDFPTTGLNTDLDLYLFQQVGQGIRYVAQSSQNAGRQEWLQRGLSAGTYYIGVQAWDTPNGRSDYWLSLRTY